MYVRKIIFIFFLKLMTKISTNGIFSHDDFNSILAKKHLDFLDLNEDKHQILNDENNLI